MTVEDELKKIMQRLGQLETHIINLIVPIQTISQTLTDPGHVKQLVNILNQPMKIDDRELSRKLEKFRESMKLFDENLDKINLAQTFAEMKYIGQRMEAIEKNLSLIQEKGLTKKVDLSFSCDGYELVKKQENYDATIPVVDPHKADLHILGDLDEEMRKVICYRYGLLGTKIKTQDALAKIMKMCVSKVRALEQKALRRIRGRIINKQLLEAELQPESLKIKLIGIQSTW